MYHSFDVDQDRKMAQLQEIFHHAPMTSNVPRTVTLLIHVFFSHLDGNSIAQEYHMGSHRLFLKDTCQGLSIGYRLSTIVGN